MVVSQKNYLPSSVRRIRKGWESLVYPFSILIFKNKKSPEISGSHGGEYEV
jgi:hypothetical protein